MLLEADDLEMMKREMNAVLKNLDEMEVSWSTKQRELQKQKLMSNLQKKVRCNDFVDQILMNCKQNNGPVTTVQELKSLVRENQFDDLKTILRQEIQYQRVLTNEMQTSGKICTR